MTLEERLKERRICICAGSGGVGKTTTSAAIALGLARRGRRVAVVTIDPAKRLATSLGLEELDNEPRLVDPALLEQAGVPVEGELWAMMLDAKRTFDELIARLAPDERTRRDVLENRIYQELSSAVAGSQEFTAVAKLFELDRSGRFDAIVLDTPPSRSALDFLDAPTRLTQFFEGRALKVFLAPTGLATRIVGRGASAVFSIFSKIAGVDLISDLSVFFRALGGLIDGFRERATSVSALLRDPATTFLVITSPEREPSEEAIFFHRKLREAGMPFGGLIVNRVHDQALDGHTAEQTAALLQPALGDALAQRVAANLADFNVLAERDRRQIERLKKSLAVKDPVLVPHLDADVADLQALATIEQHLFADAPES
ncbi:MAG TPA: ArsA family ATPase [Solirubrobacteraceae bacterium]|nr:ArsA family ATPase [Solirubrobacteraceae bacterium]